MNSTDLLPRLTIEERKALKKSLHYRIMNAGTIPNDVNAGPNTTNWKEQIGVLLSQNEAEYFLLLLHKIDEAKSFYATEEGIKCNCQL